MIVPPVVVLSWSSTVVGSRNEPLAARAIRCSASGSAWMPSASQIPLSTWAISRGDGRLKLNRWQRERIVGRSFAGSVVQSTKTTCSGGSSSVFSRAFEASAVSEWASSRM